MYKKKKINIKFKIVFLSGKKTNKYRNRLKKQFLMCLFEIMDGFIHLMFFVLENKRCRTWVSQKSDYTNNTEYSTTCSLGAV